MNDQLQAQLSTILQSLSNVGVEAYSKLPEVATQYIFYGYLRDIFYIVVNATLFIISVWSAVKLYKKASSLGAWDRDGWVVMASLCAMVSFSVLILMVNCSKDLILNIASPTVWFLTEVKYLLS